MSLNEYLLQLIPLMPACVAQLRSTQTSPASDTEVERTGYTGGVGGDVDRWSAVPRHDQIVFKDLKVAFKTMN